MGQEDDDKGKEKDKDEYGKAQRNHRRQRESSKTLEKSNEKNMEDERDMKPDLWTVFDFETPRHRGPDEEK